MENNKVKFIRKNGKIIPIRTDGGADLRSTPRYDKQITKNLFNKFGKERTVKQKFKLGLGMSVGLGSIGLMTGNVIDIAKGARNFKFTKRIGIGMAGLGMISGLLDKSKVISTKKYNKEFGKAYSNKSNKGSSV